jgi:hypothetical protein
VYLWANVWEAVDALAKASGLSVSAVFRDLIQPGLAKAGYSLEFGGWLRTPPAARPRRGEGE